MDSKELSAIAKDITDTILSQELSKSEIVMLAALVQARVISVVLPTSSLPVVPTQKEPAIKEDNPTTQVKKRIQYDEYDPPPAVDIVEPPPRETSTGKELAPANKACVCSACQKVVYITNASIKDGCKIADFIKAFTPTEGMPFITRKSEIQNIDGNISMDCPSCKTSKSLYLIGRKPNKQTEVVI